MQTIFDWLSVILFGLIALTFLQRSVKRPQFHDPILGYLPPTLGCVLSNWLGNNKYELTACFVLIISVVYTWYVIRPLKK